MTPATLKALRGSIAKWKAIEEGTGCDNGKANCPLCAEFYGLGEISRCSGCPVRERSGFKCCCNTPYDEWDGMFDLCEFPRYAETEEEFAAASKFRKWLERLLPKKGKK